MLSQDILNTAMVLMFGVIIALIGVLQISQVLSCASWTLASCFKHCVPRTFYPLLETLCSSPDPYYLTSLFCC